MKITDPEELQEVPMQLAGDPYFPQDAPADHPDEEDPSEDEEEDDLEEDEEKLFCLKSLKSKLLIDLLQLQASKYVLGPQKTTTAPTRDEQKDRTDWNRPEPDRNREPASVKIKNRTGPVVLSVPVLPVPGSYRFLSCLQMLEPVLEK
ncbi:unnamed protein product [Lactuca saligna]|uniref:Uncharacterized protein n=1 Tax=Lactuca saligna TaxID=75948 RepID=A0AA35VG57_LACSI|nr:unnamed protein product [Lactuca saligna]